MRNHATCLNIEFIALLLRQYQNLPLKLLDRTRWFVNERQSSTANSAPLVILKCIFVTLVDTRNKRLVQNQSQGHERVLLKFNPKSDQNIFSSNNINAMSIKQLMRMWKIIKCKYCLDIPAEF